MKKILIGITVILVLIFVFAYGLLFTQPGNNILKPTVESKINSILNTRMRVEQFSLRPSYIALKLETPKGSIFTVKGKFGLFSKKVDLKYTLSVNKNEDKFKFKQFELKGPFDVEGTAAGFINGLLTINGRSNFAASNILYKIELKNKKPLSADINISNLRLRNLLVSINKPIYADALIKATIKIESFEKNKLKGKGNVYITDGMVNQAILKKRFNITLPKTVFKAVADVTLNGSVVGFSSNLNSNLLKMAINGLLNQQTDRIDGKYKLIIAKLSLLKPITNMALKGSFATEGTLKGTKNILHLSGTSSVADSATSYNLEVRNLNIKKINILLKHAKLQKILAILNKPVYASGLVDARIDMSNMSPSKLSGNIDINISRGVVNKSVIKKLFNLNMPATEFSSSVVSDIKNGVAVSKIKVHSSIASLRTKKTIFDIKKAGLNSDYILTIPDLDKLYFITNMHMKGAAAVAGKISYSAGNLIATAFSNMLGGKINIKLSNNNLTGKANNISMVKVLEMMRYNKIFNSNGDVNFKYNLSTKKGTVNALFVNGHILPNRVTFLLHNMAKFDITREIYKTTRIDSVINNKVVRSNLDMISRLTHITSHNALIDLNRNFIDAKIKVAIKKSSVYVKLKGNIKHPRIKIDFRNLIKHKIEKKVKKRVETLIKGLFK